MLQNHLRKQIMATVYAGHQVTLVSSDGIERGDLAAISGVVYKVIEIPRKISILKDIRALIKLYFYFKRERFDIVHSVTPKAGMLCAIAALLAGIPIRLHTFTGQAWVELRGFARWGAILGDWLASRLNTVCYADSKSQKDFLVENDVVVEKKTRVIGSGSIAGVDLEKFNPGAWIDLRDSIRRELSIAPSAKVVTFIGRVTRDKGISELVTAFGALLTHHQDCVLLIVGPQETEVASLPASVSNMIATSPTIRNIGYARQPEKFLSITDLLCLPSYREGFGNVVIEAAAMGVPTVGSDIIGLQDAIDDGVTGILVPPKNADALGVALIELLDNPDRIKWLGLNARQRVVDHFTAEKVNAEVLKEYISLAQKAGVLV